MTPSLPVLLVDDDEEFLSVSELTLSLAGITPIVACHDSSRVKKLLETQSFSVVVLDLVMPGMTGAELLPLVIELQPDVPVLFLTGMNDAATAVDLIRKGAFDYLTKPLEANRLVTSLKMAIENGEIRKENKQLADRLLSGALGTPETFASIVTRSAAMKAIFAYIEAIAPTSLPVLITGETGVGKEMLAQAIHKASGRSGEFVPVNSAGLDDQLFSDTIFGHVKGSFTGAVADRKGLIAQAAHGTLFLDEIGDLSPESQIKILRFTQNHEFYPLGSDVAVKTDARFVFATNRDLEAMVESGEFRKDLYYRLRSHRIQVPALRNRPEDIRLLLDHFLAQACREMKKSLPPIGNEFYAALAGYSFPGNIRELEGLVYDSVVRHQPGTAFRLAPGTIQESARSTLFPGPNLFSEWSELPTLSQAGTDLVEEALSRTQGNQTQAARILGLTRTALNKRLNKQSPEIGE